MMMAAADSNDGQLVRAACAGKPAAVSALIDRHWPIVHKLLARAIGDWVEAEDLAQETMLQAVTRLSELRDPERFRPWLYTIALNRARLWWRRAPARRHTQSLDTLLVETPVAVERHMAGDGVSAEAAWEANDLARAIGRAISVLPPPQHQAIVAHYVEGLTYDEIATLLVVPVSTIRGRLHHARGRLRRELAHLTSEGYAEFDRPPYAPSGRKRPRRLAMTYVEMIVDSIRIDIHGKSRMVVLKEPDGDQTLPIIIGPAEAEAIAIKLQDSPIPRPLTHDLALSLATAFGATIQEVRVTKLEEETFHAAVVIARDGESKEMDARTSDGVALALRAQVPIYVHTSVVEKALANPPDTSSGSPPWTRAGLEPPAWPPLPDWVASETRQRIEGWVGKMTMAVIQLAPNARPWGMGYGAGVLAPSHILAAALFAHGHAAKICRELGSDPKKWRAAVKRVLGERGRATRVNGVETWTRETVPVAERAIDAAQRLGSQYLGTEHVLLALVEVADAEPESDLAKLFGALELDLPAVRSAVEAAAADTGASPVVAHQMMVLRREEAAAAADAGESRE